MARQPSRGTAGAEREVASPCSCCNTYLRGVGPTGLGYPTHSKTPAAAAAKSSRSGACQALPPLHFAAAAAAEGTAPTCGAA